MDQVVEEVWEVADGRVTPFPGNYSDYLERCARGDRPAPLPLHDEVRSSRALRPAPAPVVEAAPPREAGVDPAGIDWGAGGDVRRRKSKDDKRAEAELRQRRQAQTRPLRDALEAAERQVAALEDRLTALRATQADPAHYGRPEEVRSVAREVTVKEAELAVAYERWESAVAALEQAEAEID
jgi:ATP-binding cassette subfamily F protein 3